MKTLVVYESMYGNTRQLAEAIAGEMSGASAVPVWSVEPSAVAAADCLVIGAPTHAFGMPRRATRAQARAQAAAKPALHFEAPTDDVGVREWLARVDLRAKDVAVFDTRVDVPLPHAARRVRRAVIRAGGDVIAHSESFLVTKANALAPGELERAKAWGRMLSSVRRCATT